MATKTWIGSVSTDWNDPNNWSLFGVPASSDDVAIGTTVNSPTLSVGTTVNTVTISGSDMLTLAGADTILTVTNGISLTSTGGISGAGLLDAAVTASAAAHITAAGGTLEVTGAISGSDLVLTITGAGDRLLLDSTSQAHSVSFNGASGTLELGAGAQLTVGTTLAIGGGTAQLDNGQLSAKGITLSTGTITGAGTVGSGITATGAAHITATGGTLEVLGRFIDSGNALVLTIAGANDRLIAGQADPFHGLSSYVHAVSFNGSSGTLEITYGGLSVFTQIDIGSGTLQIDPYRQGLYGGLDDPAGVTISTGRITGTGGVVPAVTATGAATIVPGPGSGMGLLIESITDNGSAVVVDLTNGLLTLGEGPGTESTVHKIIFGGGLTVDGSLTVGTRMDIGGGTLSMIRGTFTDASGVTLGGGTITGNGLLNADVSGSGTITSGFGSTLHLAGIIQSGPTLRIADFAGSALSIENNATAAAPIAINSSNQTLAIASTGNLTINGGAESITNGMITIATGGQLSAGAGFIVGSGATLIGLGKVTGAISGSGIVEAKGGSLELVSAIPTSAGTAFEIFNSASAALLLDNVPGTGNTFTFIGSLGHLALANDTGFNDTVAGLHVGTGSTQTNFIDILDHTVTISAVTGQGTTSGTITLSNGAVLNLTNLSSTTWFANAVSDGASGTDINLQSSPPPPPPPGPPVPPPNDFYGNGFSDILWQNSDGTAAIWKMNGATPTAGPVVGNPGASWQVVGSGDFNRDGFADILWQNSDGTVAIWEMNGGTAIAAPVIANPGTSWQVAGTGDFTGDGFSDDILWRNTDGRVAIWEMNGANVIAAPVIADNPGTSWRIAGTGDFYGNGYSDILWQNSDGRVAIWEMNGATQIATPVIGNPGTSWKAVGAGDFNRDGHSDILWQNSDGTVAIWEMNGATPIAAPVIGNPGTAWTAIGAEDFTGDGFSDDILWRNSDGTIAIWEMNGATVTAAPVVGNPGASWHPILGSSSGTTGGAASGAASAAGGSGGAGFGFGDISAPVPPRSATAASGGITPVSQASGSDALLLPPGATPPLVDPTTPHCALSG